MLVSRMVALDQFAVLDSKPLDNVLRREKLPRKYRQTGSTFCPYHHDLYTKMRLAWPGLAAMCAVAVDTVTGRATGTLRSGQIRAD